MTKQEDIFKKIAESLLTDYSSVYYVDMNTNEYFWYSLDSKFHSLHLEQGGDDFFVNLVRDCKKVVYGPDQHIFLEDNRKEKLICDMKQGTMENIEYRLVIDGVPTWHSLRLIRGMDENRDYSVLGVINIDELYRQRELEKELESRKEAYNQIAFSFAEQFDTLYYIDTETSTYIEISSTDEYKKLNVPATGNDFFAESRRSIRKYVHPEDQDMVIRLHYKDVMLKNLENRDLFAVTYRLLVDGQIKNIRHLEIMARDGKHLVVCIENIDDEVRRQLAIKESQEKSVTFTQIAERLASHYDLIYYIDTDQSHYVELSTRKEYGALEIQDEGGDFFEVSRKNADRYIYPEDRDRVRLFLDRDYLISNLDRRRQLNVDYRVLAGNDSLHYTRMSAIYSSDRSHFIICVENREEDVRREREHLEALSIANEMARRDELTGTKNKTAYREKEKELQGLIREGGEPFGIVVCDINGLKTVNDTEGHRAGDDYIRDAGRMICRVFSHSPVFRIGGDEFEVVLKGEDYANRDGLISTLKRRVEENIRNGEGPVVAAGLSVYRPKEDQNVADIFVRADHMMYEDKARLKEQKLLYENYSSMENEDFRAITEERRNLLDSLFKSYEVISEGNYVYLCDMKHDYSRWSKSAVDLFGLPSEYMYGAGDIWENRIHPEDREAYHKGIDEIFAGIAADHDMQYRARRVTGEYDVCTCRGVVIRDLSGEPEYFAGSIRNHGLQGHMDTLTGLRNQYGFFEDLDSWIKRDTQISVCLFGINRFSEINDMFGYHFGNRTLQTFARTVYEMIGNSGHCYRIDGSKFAVISNTLNVDEMREKYERFRAYLHEDFQVDGKKLLLELQSGALQVDYFDVDSQTVYACLNFAYRESKIRRHGAMVEFRNSLDGENHQMVEKLYAIRSSIMRRNEGFFLLFQPVVDAQTEALTGAEALLRWKNDVYGMVPPDQFIPVLESDPLFPELGEWIIRESIMGAKQILTRHPDFVINVNLSYTQIEIPGFTDMVFDILEELSFPPEHLCLEVTERCRLLDMELLKNVATSLKARGVRLALDDFGTGFSSVGILKEIPFDTIKIDRSFVMNIENNDLDRSLVQIIAGLAPVFGAKLCVEGIETEGMRDLLRSFRVGSFQGYYYSRPIPVEDVREWRLRK